MSGTTSPRMRKVNELMREVIADSVTELEDPGIGFLTITGVDTSPDLRTAIVFYSVLGSDDEKAATAAALERAAPHLQEAVGHQVRMKYTPRLSFRVDPAIDEGLKIDRLLRQLHDEGEEA